MTSDDEIMSALVKTLGFSKTLECGATWLELNIVLGCNLIMTVERG